jgi:uncharacterized coiled-coil protein SlyX
MEAKTEQQRALAHISNKVDELHVEVERLQELIRALCGQKVQAAAKLIREATA